MVSYMNAPRFVGNGQIEWGKKEVPEPGPGQLLVQVRANALCGSDRHQFYQGTDIVPGHEASGVVVATGSGTTIEIGTPGVIFLMDFCGECRNCRLGFTNLCLAKRADMGFNRDGGYGQYMLIHENIFFPIDADLPFVEATMLLDIMGTGGHAINRARLVHPDIQSVIVSGAGPIGLGVLAMAKTLLGVDVPVFITDFAPYRLELAARLGGLPIDLAKGTLEDGLGTHGYERIDVAIDTSGKASARQASLAVVAKPGALVCVGHGEGLTLDVSRDLIGTEHTVLGSEYFTFGELAGNLVHLRNDRDYFGQIITHRFGVDELQHAYELFFRGETGKVVVQHDD
ncbi:MAG TPA: alcohol dehydrogenase catalytic domain-containing protein [Thermomicrobiales bacterium]|nr:alcohol dehydrogenase catalytic domain-containing protein [Thermomicrobiales bacterium]